MEPSIWSWNERGTCRIPEMVFSMVDVHIYIYIFFFFLMSLSLT